MLEATHDAAFSWINNQTHKGYRIGEKGGHRFR